MGFFWSKAGWNKCYSTIKWKTLILPYNKQLVTTTFFSILRPKAGCQNLQCGENLWSLISGKWSEKIWKGYRVKQSIKGTHDLCLPSRAASLNHPRRKRKRNWRLTKKASKLSMISFKNSLRQFLSNVKTSGNSDGYPLLYM